MNSSQYHAILFDLDGTLLDYEKSAYRALSLTFKGHGINNSFNQIYDEYKRINLEYWSMFERSKISSENLRVARFRDLIEQFNWPLDAIKISTQYLSNLSQQVDYIPRSIQLIQELSATYRIGILTNGIAHVQRGRLSRCEFGSQISAVIISDEYGIAKPDRRIFNIALEELSCHRLEVLYVGDSINSDMVGAVNAGIDFCWFNPLEHEIPENYSPKFVIKSLSEIQTLLI